MSWANVGIYAAAVGIVCTMAVLFTFLVVKL